MDRGNLLQELNWIEQSEFAHLDRRAEYADAIKHYANKNDLVRRAADGELYLPEEFDGLIERVGGKRLYYPNRPDAGDYKKLAEFKEIVGNISGPDIIINPVVAFGSTGIILSTLVGLGYKLAKEDKKISRRDFWKTCARIGAFSAIFGGASFYNRFDANHENNKKREDVEYVQKKIGQYGHF